MKISEFIKICNQIKDVSGIDSVKIYAEEDQGMRKLQDATGTILVGVIPSVEFSGTEDAYIANSSCIFFFLQKERESQSSDKELEQYSQTQDCLIKFKEWILGDDKSLCKIFPKLQISSVSIDPEYNVFGKYLGWSIKFGF